MGFGSKHRRKFKRAKYGRRSRRKSLMATNAGPWVAILGVVAGVGALACAVIFLLVPFIKGIYNFGGGQTTPTVIEGEPTPAPTFRTIQTVELGSLQKEIIVQQKYLSHPWIYDSLLFYSAGTDSAGGPKMNNLYSYDMQSEGSARRLEIELENDDFLYPRVNGSWLVFLDNNRSGGGKIKAMNRQSGELLTVKEYYSGQPVTSLWENYVVWTERTGTYRDKLFVYDLNTHESVAVATFENSVYGTSQASAGGGEIVWADGDASGEGTGSVICSLKMDGSGGGIETYAPGMYVHDPVTNGSAWAWIDSNHTPGAKLYLRVSRGEPVLISDEVVHYALGEDFLAYSKNRSIYVYFWSDGYEQIITPSGELCQLIGVCGRDVLWYDVTVNDRDILKFATVS